MHLQGALFTAGAEARGRVSVPVRFGLPADTPTVRLAGTPRLVVGISDPHGIRSVSPIASTASRLRARPRATAAPFRAACTSPSRPCAAASGNRRASTSPSSTFAGSGRKPLAVAPRV